MYKICKRCVMDTTDPEIVFDENGFCNHCNYAIKKLESLKDHRDLDDIIGEIKRKGEKKEYDCVVGVSGGADSSYVLWLLGGYGFRPFVVHVDNGWDTELSVHNMSAMCDRLNFVLHTFSVDSDEFADLQLSFLKASTPDLEIPTDHIVGSMLKKIAVQRKIKYVISGANTATESISVPRWSHGHFDWRYIKLIQKRFGSRKLKTCAHTTLLDVLYQQVFGKVKVIRILDHLNVYNKKEATTLLEKGFGWMNYKTKHGESTYTFFVQAYVLPKKFGYDKRKMHLSNLICAGQMTRDDALAELKKPLFTENELDMMMMLVCMKLHITREQLDSLLRLPNKSYYDYPSYETHLVYRMIKRVYKKVAGL